MNGLVILGWIAICQGLYLCLTSWLLSFSRSTKIALTLLMGSHIVLLLTVIVYEMDWYEFIPHFLYVRVPIPLLFGPALYMLYTGLFPNEKPVRRHFLLHFIPFLVYVLLMIPYYVQPSAVKLSTSSYSSFIWVNYGFIEQFKVLHPLAYLIWIGNQYQQRGQKTLQSYLQILAPYRKLFMWILLGYASILLVGMVNVILLYVGINNLYHIEFIIVLITTLLAYAIAYVFIKYDSQWKKVYKRIAEGHSPVAKQIIQALTDLMEEQKLYTNATLKIQEVAEVLGIPRQDLSRIINAELHMNFAQFVNGYRIQEFKTKVQDPKENYKTLLGLAYESGFNSKTSFQRIFKETTGMTPKAYKKSMIKKSQ